MLFWTKWCRRTLCIDKIRKKFISVCILLDIMADPAIDAQTGHVNKRRLSLTRNLIAGSIGGMTGWIAGQPLDMVKVRLQVQPKQNPLYKGPIDCLIKVIKTEGFTGLYRGMFVPVLMAAPACAASFYALSLGKSLQLQHPDQEPTLLQYFNAGLFCGVFSALIFAPAERLKCLLQVQKATGGTPKYTGTVDCFIKVMKESGLRGVYRGLGPTFGREIPGSGAWYLAYEGLLKLSRSDGRTRDEVGPITVVLAGGTSGMVFWGLTFPVDAIKTRMQVAPIERYPRGTRDVIKEVIKSEGLKALYRGYAPALTRAVVVHAALFVGYEFTMKAMNWISP